MSQKVANQINCLQRLQDTTGQLEEILVFLKLEQLVDDNQMKSVKLSADHAKEVQQILRDLQVRNKLQMLTYEWNVLPVENIMISIVTERNSREFTFNR
jgi:hypothetical protein